MLDAILSLLGGFKGLIVGVLGLLGGLWALWTKKQNERLRQENEQHRQAERVYKAKEEVRQHDITEDYNREQHVIEVREKVDAAKTESEAADVVSGSLNDYFNGERK